MTVVYKELVKPHGQWHPSSSGRWHCFFLLSCATPTTYTNYNQVMDKWQIFFSSFYYACCRSVSIFFGFCQLNLYFYYHVYTQTFLLNHMINKNMPNLEGVFVCSVIHMHTYSTHRERGRAQKGYNTLNISVQKCSCTWHIHTFKSSNIHENSISHGNMQYAMQSQNKYIIH